MSGRLAALREAMRVHQLQAFIVPSSDAHMSEYICEADKQRDFLTQFTGSNGTAVVTQERAAMWTDGRYFLQASQQLNQDWILMKSGLPDTPTLPAWILEQLPDGGRVGLEAQKASWGSYKKWCKDLKSGQRGGAVEIVPVGGDVFAACWPDRPAYPQQPAFAHPTCYSGQSTVEKVKKVREEMEKKKVNWLAVSALDEVAWLLNVRGSDIEYNPVVLSYAVVALDQLFWYVDESKVPQDCRDHMEANGVTIRPYDAIVEDLQVHARTERVWLDPSAVNLALIEAVPKEHRVFERSPVAVLKATKNQVEQEGLRKSCLRDSVAIVEYFNWLATTLAQGEEVTELQGAEKLASFRQQCDLYVGPSFETITSTGPNAAICHYRAEEGKQSVIEPQGLYLCDSGGQFYDGTTDVTRTLHFGTPTSHQIRCFTRVLQGHINLATAVFPKGTVGRSLDAIARLPLWEDGLDYRHGTGHGVGSFLNVHEPPTLISSSDSGNLGAYYNAPLQPGMTVTIEPGYYEDGAFGIRIENDYLVAEKKTLHNFQDTPFYTFENLTWVPLQPNLIDGSLLNDVQKKWVREYQQECRKRLSNLVSDSAKDYLLQQTEVPF